MAHQQQCRAIFAAGLANQGERFAGVLMVKIAGGFVGKHQLGSVGQRPGDGDPLLLPGRKLARIMFQAVPQTNPLQQRPGIPFGFAQCGHFLAPDYEPA